MTGNPEIEGIIVPLITPFNDSGDLAPEKAGPLIEHLAAAGVNGFYVGGSTGEGLLQSVEERSDYLAWVAESAPDGAALIAQVGAMSARDAKRLAGEAARYGYDAISSTPPFYFNYSTSEVIEYYRDLAASSELPLLLYNVPATTGRNIPIEVQIEMLRLPNVIGSKHTDTNMYHVERLMRSVEDTVILHGADEMLVAGLAMGARGGVGSTYNLMAAHYVDIWNAFRNGDLDRARASQRKVNDVIDELLKLSSGVIPGIKLGLAMLGFDVGPPRQPFRPLTADSSAFEHALKTCID